MQIKVKGDFVCFCTIIMELFAYIRQLDVLIKHLKSSLQVIGMV